MYVCVCVCVCVLSRRTEILEFLDSLLPSVPPGKSSKLHPVSVHHCQSLLVDYIGERRL